MKLNFSLILFYFMIILGTILSVSSNNWVMIWIGLELSTMFFISLMSSKSMISSESSMKYFIVQSVSSAIFLFCIMFKLMGVNLNMNLITALAMMIKMGVFPFHNWVISMVEGLSYWILFNMLTLMKIVPLYILNMCEINLNIILMLTMIFGSLGGLTQNSIHKMIGYSSIFNMGFMIFLSVNFKSCMIYLLIYSFSLGLFLMAMEKNKIYYINHIILNQMSIFNKLTMWAMILSLGGMPPTLGFFIKFKVIELALMQNEILVVLTMILSSLITMYFYNRICFGILYLWFLNNKWNIMFIKNFNIIFMMIAMLSLPVSLMLKIYF